MRSSIRQQPTEAVRGVLAENIQGVGEEVAGLRSLARGLLALQEKVRSRKEAARLMDAYTMAAARLGTMIQLEERLGKNRAADEWAYQVLAMVDGLAAEMGKEPVSPAVLAAMRGGAGDLETASRRLVEESAATRCVLRNTVRLADECLERAGEAGEGPDLEEVGEYVHLTEIYGNGCNRLMRLLRAEGAGGSSLADMVRKEIDEAIREVMEEFGWRKG